MQTLAQLTSGKLKHSKRLQLVENLTVFPQEIFSLADSLEILDLSNNQLSALPDEFSCLKNLKILFLSQNNFTELPSILKQCESLEMIGFKSNQISKIDEDSLPEKTRWLILTDNEITSLPDSMGSLANLQKLMLAGNKLSKLPSSMNNCKKLELIRLSENRLTELPNWLLQLPKLAWLAFSGNPVSTYAKSDIVQIPQVTSDDLAIGECIGEGASGIIYHANWLNKPESLSNNLAPIAVKIFKGNITSDGSPDDELNACLKVGFHSNLVSVSALLKTQDKLGLVMNLIPRNYFNLGLPPSFSSCTRDTFDLDKQYYYQEIQKMCLAMLNAIEHMHSKDICHGDIYAHNILINQDCQLLFGDFGAASNYGLLPTEQQRYIEIIELRAFACLIDDLIGLAKDIDVRPKYYLQLKELRDNLINNSIDNFTSVNDAIELLK
ncbi:leucine-rich repeat-containing protein kinase family protein [Thalassomonas sp. M1454]|uniref:leucine-rich repeat-containing protein kinase family protein n=1 Tax=Thalassomonas sp. M1454 TaxID=2594477 RepID=UPI00117C256D|nr:leucine-rich repeat domain-containing protein [Thalassomonas sp. M1454]TRX53864.1 protein kinase [Thalassomonas sp. M1454]